MCGLFLKGNAVMNAFVLVSPGSGARTALCALRDDRASMLPVEPKKSVDAEVPKRKVPAKKAGASEQRRRRRQLHRNKGYDNGSGAQSEQEEKGYGHKVSTWAQLAGPLASDSTVHGIVEALEARLAQAPAEILSADVANELELRKTVETVFLAYDGALSRHVASSVVHSLCRNRMARVALAVHDVAEAASIALTGAAFAALLSSLSREGRPADVQRLFSRMQALALPPSRVAFAAVMQAEARAGLWEAVMGRLQEMRAAGLQPDIGAYNCAIAACGRSGQVAESESLWRQLTAERCPPSPGTHALLMSTFVQAGRCDLALEVLFAARLAGDPVSRDMLRGAVSVAAKSDRWPLALDLLGELMAEVAAEGGAQGQEHGGGGQVAAQEGEAQSGGAQGHEGLGTGAAEGSHASRTSPGGRNSLEAWRSPGSDAPSIPVLTFNSVITALSRAGKGALARQVFLAMQRMGVAPDHFTWSSLASAFAREGDLEAVVLLNDEMQRRHGLRPTVVVCNCVLVACQKGGRWQEALAQLDRMQRMGLRPDPRSYASAIVACEGAGEWREAMRLFERMQASGCLPNSYAYTALLRTLGKARQWRQVIAVYEDAMRLGIMANEHVDKALIDALFASHQYDLAGKYQQRLALRNRDDE